MCTVTYLPRPGRGFTLTSNRDEQPDRAAAALARQPIDAEEVLFPRDPGAGGTWMAMANSGRSVCLLNGAFSSHTRRPPYRRSRGLMVLDFFRYEGPADFVRRYPFEGMEPFTLIMCDANDLVELRWDGQTTYLKARAPDTTHIWSSATLYDRAARQQRQAWFDDWLKQHPEPSAAEVLHFHRTAGSDDPYNGVVMNRANLVRTTSITQIDRGDRETCMRYEALLQPTVEQRKCILHGEVVG